MEYLKDQKEKEAIQKKIGYVIKSSAMANRNMIEHVACTLNGER